MDGRGHAGSSQGVDTHASHIRLSMIGAYSLGTCHPQTFMMVRERGGRLRGGKIMADPASAPTCHLGKPPSKVHERQTDTGALEEPRK